MQDRLLALWSYFSGMLVITVVAFIFLYVLFKGGAAITPEFLLAYPQGMPLGTSGGIFPAIAGSLYLGVVAAFLASLFSVATAVYMVFFCRNRFIYEFNSFMIQCVSGIPSIVLGLFGYSLLIMELDMPKSLLSAGITLAVMIMPFITLRVEKILREFPQDMIAAALALGVSRTYVIFSLIIPACRREIAASVTLAAAYAMGATAPIMFTGAALYTGSLPSLTSHFMALPYHLYILVNEGYSLKMAYGTAFVLMAMLLGINLSCQFLGRKRG